MRRFVLNFINTICPRFLTRFYLAFCVNLISFVGIRGDAAGFFCSPYASVAGLLDDARFGGVHSALAERSRPISPFSSELLLQRAWIAVKPKNKEWNGN